MKPQSISLLTKKMEIKKGIQLNQAFGAVLALVLVAILVVVAIVLFSSLMTSIPNQAGSSFNETFTPSANGTVTAVSNSTLCDFSDFAVTYAVNSTDNVTVDSTWYTVGSTGTITPAVPGDNASYLDGTWKLLYTYTYGTAECDASSEMIDQFATYPVLIGLLGTIIFLGLVIGVLVAAFVFGGKDSV